MKAVKVFTAYLAFFLIFSLLLVQKVFSQELPWATVEQRKEENTPQSLKNLPEWDGIYIVTRTDYIELSTKKPCEGPKLCFQKYIETVYVPASDFVGILVKGKDYLERLKFRRIKSEKGLFGDRLFSPRNYTLLPPEQIRRKVIAPETYFFVFTENVTKLFGMAEEEKYMGISLDKNDQPEKTWIVGFQESAFGGGGKR